MAPATDVEVTASQGRLGRNCLTAGIHHLIKPDMGETTGAGI